MADKVQERVADLLELMTAAQKNVTSLGMDQRDHANAVRANLRATIETIGRELARARQDLHRAAGLDSPAEILANLKTQARTGLQTAKWAKTRSQTQRALELAVAQEAAKAILGSAAASARKTKRNTRAKKGK